MDSNHKTSSSRDSKGRFQRKAEVHPAVSIPQGIPHYAYPKDYAPTEAKPDKVQWVEPPTRSPNYFKLGLLVVIAVSAFAVSAWYVKAQELTPRNYMDATCRARMVGLLVTDRLLQRTPNRLPTETMFEEVQEEVLFRLAKQDDRVVSISEATSVLTACKLLWEDLNQDFEMTPKMTTGTTKTE
jgi:hypothetical protein